jgi:hypothetical protein
VAAIVAVLLLVRIVLPYAVEWAVPRIAASQNLYVTLGNVDFGLIVGEITLENLVVDFPRAEAAGEASLAPVETASPRPLLSLDRLYVSFEWTELLSRRLHITDLELLHPVIAVSELSDGSLELPLIADEGRIDATESDAPVETAIDGDPKADSSDGPDWALMLDRFELNKPDIAVRKHETQEEVVRVAAEQFGIDMLSVGSDGIGLDGLDLEHPEIFVQRQWLLGRLQAKPVSEAEVSIPEEPDTSATGMPSIRTHRLKIERAAFTLRTQEGPVEVALRLEVTEAGTDPGETFPIDLGLEIDEAIIEIRGRLGLNPTSFVGQLEWQNLGVPPFLLLAYPKLVPWLASCQAAGDIQIDFQSAPDDGPARLTASGTTTVSNLAFKHPETGELALEWEALEVEIREVFVPLTPTADLPSRFELSRLTLSAPLIVYTNPPDAVDELLAAMDEGSASGDDSVIEGADESAVEAASVPTIAIGQLELTDGTLRYVDRSVKPVHETKIHKLSISVSELTATPTAGAKQFSVDALIQSKGSISLRGTLPSGRGNLDFSLKKLDLVSYDSLARDAGWKIASGLTSLDSHVVANATSYRTKNTLVLHDLDVSAEDRSGFASQFGMPVDLVLALLRDAAGDITLSVPIVVDGDGAGLDYSAALLSATRGALQGAIASPMKMLGMLVPEGAAANSLGALVFAPGEPVPGIEARTPLDALAELAKNRPMLSFSLLAHWSEDDRIPTARKIIEEKAISGDDFPEIADASFFARRRIVAALFNRAKGGNEELGPEDEALLERYVAAQEVSVARFQALAEARAESIRAALLELGVPPEAVSTGTPAPSEHPSVTVELVPGRASIDRIEDSSAR